MAPDIIKRFFNLNETNQMDLFQDTFKLDVPGLNLENLKRYTEEVCSKDKDTLIDDITLNKVMNVVIKEDATDSSKTTILVDQVDKGPKICFELDQARELLITSIDGKATAFDKIVGRMVSQTKDGDNLEMMWTESNVGDSGAN